MYHPPPPTEAEIAAGCHDADDFEYLQFTNTCEFPFNTEKVGIVAGVRFRFPDAVVAPGEKVYVVRDRNAFAVRYGTSHRVIGQFHDRLSNSGESLIVLDRKGNTLHEFTYNEAWRPDTDGNGSALEIVDLQQPVTAWNAAETWRSVDPLNSSDLLLRVVPHIDPQGNPSVRVSGPEGARISVQTSEDLVTWVDRETAIIDETEGILIELLPLNELQSVYVRATIRMEP